MGYGMTVAQVLLSWLKVFLSYVMPWSSPLDIYYNFGKYVYSSSVLFCKKTWILFHGKWQHSSVYKSVHALHTFSCVRCTHVIPIIPFDIFFCCMGHSHWHKTLVYGDNGKRRWFLFRCLSPWINLDFHLSHFLTSFSSSRKDERIYVQRLFYAWLDMYHQCLHHM